MITSSSSPAPRHAAAHVAIFATLSVALGVGATLAGVPPAVLPFVLALGPTVIALVLAWREGDGALGRLLRTAVSRPTRRAWYALVALPIAWAVATIGLAVALGEPTAGLFDAVVPAILIVPLVVLLPALAEELAWRGYAVQRLLPSMSPFAAALALAGPWAALHVLLQLPGQMNAGLELWPTILSLVGYSLILTWIYVGSGGSVLLAALVHAGFNGVAPLMAGIDPDLAWPVRAVLIAAIAAALVVVGALRMPGGSRIGAGATRGGRLATRAGAALAAVMLTFSAAPQGAAAAPGNDLPAGATSIDALPFLIDLDTTEATVAGDDVGCGAGGLDKASVWYAFTPSESVAVEIDARPSNYLVGVNLFIGTPDEDGRADCNNDALLFEADAGTTYYLAFTDVNDDGVNGGSLQADIHVAPPAVEATVTVDPTAIAHVKTGQVQVTGSIRCDREAAFAEVSTRLSLAKGRFITIGAGGTGTACGPEPTRWSTIATGENGRFQAGSAAVDITSLACDDARCTESTSETTLRLRGGTFPLPEPEPEPDEETTLLPAAANDDIGNPTVVTALPFHDEIDTTGATAGPTDPGYCFDPSFGTDGASVWYAWTAPVTGPMLASTADSDYDTSMYVGTADGAGGITVVACGDDTRTQQADVRWDAVAGETYLIAASASIFGGSTGGNLVFHLDVGPPEQVVELRVDPAGSFNGYGTATLRGTVSCTAPAPLGAILIVELDQRVGRRHLPGNAFIDIEGCAGTDIPFEAPVISPYGKYRGGPAAAQVIFAACSNFGCGNETVDLTVSLRR